MGTELVPLSHFATHKRVWRRLVQTARLAVGVPDYDRYLAQPGFRAATVGVCYRHQLVDDLPAEPHDRPVGCVVAG